MVSKKCSTIACPVKQQARTAKRSCGDKQVVTLGLDSDQSVGEFTSLTQKVKTLAWYIVAMETSDQSCIADSDHGNKLG